MVDCHPKIFANVALLTNFPNPQLSNDWKNFLKKSWFHLLFFIMG